MIGPLGRHARRLLAPLALLAGGACDDATRPENVLEADVTLARADVPQGDPLVFTVTVRNPSNRTVRLPASCYWGGAQLDYVLWKAGAPRPPPTVVCPEAQSSYRDPEQLILEQLAPGDSVVRTFQVLPSRTTRTGFRGIIVSSSWWEPGTYLVAGGLYGPDGRVRPESEVDTLRIVAP